MKLGKTVMIWALAMGFATASCGDKKKNVEVKETKQKIAKATPIKSVKPDSKPGRTLLIAESTFKKNDKGKYVIPDMATMLILTNDGQRWKMEKIEDSDSNVFHKAAAYGNEGILTIGGNKAALKLWTKKDGKWSAKTLWSPTFGGKQNRLRDFEMADFNGDGINELAVATHDQGVVAVIWHKDGQWKAEEIDRKTETFVHEIEIGDLDGDGKLEIYATPSQPNTASSHGQGGGVNRYAWNGEKFVKSQVVSLEARHIKEILVADVDGDGKQELYAALEAQMGKDGNMEAPVEIRRFDWKDGKFVPTKVATINDRFCRFLVAGDVDGDGAVELIASAFSSGVWVIEKEGDHYTPTCIDSNSGGFEHSAYLADMDADGKLELYVADDKSGSVVGYTFKNGKYESKVINKRLVPRQAMVWNITVADL